MSTEITSHQTVYGQLRKNRLPIGDHSRSDALKIFLTLNWLRNYVDAR